MENMKKTKALSVKLPAKASIWYLASGILGKGLAVLTTPFFTRLLSPQQYGEYTLYITLVGVVSISSSVVSSGSAIYDGMKRFEEGIGSYLRSALLVSSAFSLGFCLLLFTFSFLFNVNILFFLFLTVQILCDCILSVFLCSRRFYYEYKEVAVISIVSSATSPVISIILLKIIGGDYRIRIYALLAVSLALAIYAIFRIYKEKGYFQRTMAKYLIKRSLPLLPHGIGSAVCAQADKLTITAVMGSSALASYSVVHSLGLGIQFITSALGSALWPWVIRRLSQNESDKVSELFSPLLYGLAGLNLCVISIAPEIMSILAPSKYMGAFSALLPISISALASFVSSAATVALVHKGLGRSVAIASISGTLSCIILNITLISSFGYLGAGLALLFSQLLTAIIEIIALKKAGLGQILPTRLLCTVFLISLGVGIAPLLFSNLLFARVLLLCVPAVMLTNSLLSAKRLVTEI
jgi:O-antigen/teichoic acid export membrane protein